MNYILPKWVDKMDEEDLNFIRNFVTYSGSLKQMAKVYNVTYPTLRLRLDRLIQKIELTDDEVDDSYVSLVKRMAIEEKIDIATAKVLITAYKNEKRRDE